MYNYVDKSLLNSSYYHDIVQMIIYLPLEIYTTLYSRFRRNTFNNRLLREGYALSSALYIIIDHYSILCASSDVDTFCSWRN